MNVKQAIMIGLVGALTTTVMPPALDAQTCSGNGDVVGVYAFLGSRSLVTTGSDSSGTGSTGNSGGTTAPSNTPLGTLLSDINGMAIFGTVGRITADGAGNLFATPGPNTSAATQVGTYSVNGDCTISVTLTDAFQGMTGTNGTGNTGGARGNGTTTSTVPPMSANLEGVVLNRGNEIDLVQVVTSPSSSSTATPVGANITMRKMFQATGCTNATLNGGFGMASQAALSSAVVNGGTGTGNTGTGNSGGTGNTGGTATGGTTSGSQTSFPLVGRFFANGDGTLVSIGASSTLPGRQLIGNYIVNSDCTGTAQLITNSGVTRNIGFAIVQSPAGACTNSAGAPQLLFGFTDQGINGFGTASQ